MTEHGATDDQARPGWGRWAPLAIFLSLAMLLGGFLISSGFFGYDSRALPSALIGKPAPTVAMPPLRAGGEGIDAAALTAPGVKVVNVWASWCAPCRLEHPKLLELAEAGVPVFGINHKDEPANAQRFLNDLGDPYARIGVDRDGRASVEWGVYGVPETFVIDGQGRIAYKHVGPIQNDDLKRKILPAIRAAAGG
jgi:cytochrome c biogenesis protein CcmG/thiol:disulfide interchange protein DsbE